jgi:hypothetical protein
VIKLFFKKVGKWSGNENRNSSNNIATTKDLSTFFGIATSFKGPFQFPELDEIERSLLNQMALHFFEGNPLLVSDLILANETASSATLHRRLSKLLKKDLIRHGSNIDGRKKYLELTPKSRNYFSKVG